MTEVLLELTALLACWLCLAAWQRDRTARGRRLFIALCAAVSVWSAGSLAEAVGALTPDGVQRLSYLGILVLPALWLALALVIDGAPVVARAPWALFAILAPGCLLYTLLFQEPELRAWFLSSSPLGETAYGPLWWLNLGYSWSLAALGSLRFGRSARRLRARRKQARRIALAVLSVVPIAGNAVYVLTGVPGFDPTPILLGAWLVALRSELFSGDLLQVLPVSQHDLVSQLPTPLIVTDPAGRVTEINPAAQACLAVSKADALDRNIEALLEGTAFAPEFDRWPLVARGREAGSVLLPAAEKRKEDHE